MFSRSTQFKNIINAWSEINNVLVKFFLNRSVDEMRKAWTSPDSPLSPPNADHFDKDLTSPFVEGLIQQCFGVMHDKDSQEARICCSLKRLWEFLYLLICVQQPIQNEPDFVS